MAQITNLIAYRVDIIEHDRFMGCKLDSTIYFDNEAEAREHVRKFNAYNTAKQVPDWYMVAEYCGRV